MRLLLVVLSLGLVQPGADARPAAAGNTFGVSGDQVTFNGEPFKVIGLRLSNALISDATTRSLIDRLDLYKSYGVNTVSVFVMGSRFGDVKGYRPDATLDPTYAARLARIIEAADARSMIVLVGCLYWSTSRANDDLGAWTQTQANAAVANTVRWLRDRTYRNVFVDPDNEGMAHDAKGWSIKSMIDAAHAVDPTIMVAYNDSAAPPPNADLYIHHSPRVVGKPWIESEGSAPNAPGGYWGTYSKETHEKTGGRYYNYSRIGRYTAEMKSGQISAAKNHINTRNGYMMASTWLQCAPDEGVGGPFHGLGGRSNIADVNANIDVLHPDAGVLWWMEAMKAAYGAWTPPNGGGTAPSVASLTLVNADTDLDIGPLVDGQTLDLATLPTRNLSVRANTSPSTVGSVRFGYDGNANYRTENTSPYAVAGDDPRGNYNPWTPAVGTHTLTATAYSLSGAGGTAGPARTARFTVVDDASNAPPSVAITSPSNNATFSAGSTITIAASASDPDGTVSFVDFYRGTTPLGMDTATPYAFTWANVPAGTYALTAKATDNGAATATSAPITITVVSSTGPSVAGFTLVNADTDSDIGPLSNGQTIDLAALPTRRLNVRANTSPSTVGSVRFGYDGNATFRTENTAPYALAGDTSGDYNAWTPAAGTHSLTATPYTQSNAGGVAGAPRTIAFTVTDAARATADDVLLSEAAVGTDGAGSGRCGALGLEALAFAALLLRRRS